MWSCHGERQDRHSIKKSIKGMTGQARNLRHPSFSGLGEGILEGPFFVFTGAGKEIP
jgi:hypothetical protein